MNDNTQSNTYSNPPRRYVVTIHGACRGNPGPGGYGALLISFEGEAVRRTKALSGSRDNTTNIEMELQAAIKALTWLPANGVPALVRSSCQYIIKGMNEWRLRWQANGWATSDGTPVKNYDLWQALLYAVGTRAVTWEWVRADAGHGSQAATHKLAQDALGGARKSRRS